MKTILAALVAFSLAGCVCGSRHFTPEKAAAVEVGMSEDDVVALLGEPAEKEPESDYEIWRWTRTVFTPEDCGTFSTDSLALVMADGRVRQAINTTSSTADQGNVATQCGGTTQKGARCRRRTTNVSGLCYQHQ